MSGEGPFVVPGPEPPQAIVALVESFRRTTETALRVGELPGDVAQAVDRVRAELDHLERRLAPHAPDDRVPSFEAGSARRYFRRSVLMPDFHPLRPELEIRSEEGATRGRVRFGVTFEGPPGCVHGGFVAHFFDQILGQHVLDTGLGAMTSELDVRYRRGTPIFRDLDFEVTHERRDERSVVARGRLEADGRVFAEATGLFILPRSAPWR